MAETYISHLAKTNVSDMRVMFRPQLEFQKIAVRLQHYNANHAALVGASSRLGISLMQAPGFQGVGIARKQIAGSKIRLISSYSNLSASDFAGMRTVVNLTGLVNGTFDELRAVNVNLATRVAQCAKEAGVRSFFQISSFSLYGSTELIGTETAFSPVSHYGLSRVEGETAVSALASDSFSVTLLRLPMLYGLGDSKLERLVNLWLRARYFPIRTKDVERSMIHYDLAAQAIQKLIESPPGKPVFLADPACFRFRTAAETLSVGSGKNIAAIPLLATCFAPLRLFAPAFYYSVVRSAALKPEANSVISLGMKSRLYNDLLAMGREF